jgi:exopolyphosphatase / guanosine-5'-triphosphate,3'-diphosphate pyrophosphatase
MTQEARGRRVATIDVGTNTLLLLVVEVGEGGELVRVADRCEFGRLGRGVDARGALDFQAISRSLEIVRGYAQEVRAAGVERVAAVGTQALREAGNAGEFLEPAERILGVPVEVIAGEREAELVSRAVAESLPALAGGDLVIADVGGGSTEVIVAGQGELRSLVSLPIGAVRLTERYLHGDPPAAEEARALVADIDAQLATLDLPERAPLVGTSGTATTLVAVEQHLRIYDPDAIHGQAIATAEVERQLASLLELKVAERRRIPGMEPQRADVIAAGVAIYARLLHHLGAPQMVVSDRGVRWGLAYELANQTGSAGS